MIVVDASIAVRILSRESGADEALERISAEDARCAPDWIRLEVANAMARKVRENALTRSDAMAAAAGVTTLVDEQFDSFTLMDDAFALSIRIRHPMYDCLYLAAGLRHGAIVVTSDGKFAERAIAAGFGFHLELLA